MRVEAEQHMVNIVKALRFSMFERDDRHAIETMLTNYVARLPQKDLVEINATMYLGRDRNASSTIELYLERCGYYSKEELIRAMLVRLGSLQDYLVNGLVQTRPGLDIVKTLDDSTNKK